MPFPSGQSFGGAGGPAGGLGLTGLGGDGENGGRTRSISYAGGGMKGMGMGRGGGQQNGMIPVSATRSARFPLA